MQESINPVFVLTRLITRFPSDRNFQKDNTQPPLESLSKCVNINHTNRLILDLGAVAKLGLVGLEFKSMYKVLLVQVPFLYIAPSLFFSNLNRRKISIALGITLSGIVD